MDGFGDTFWLILSYQMDTRDLEAVPQMVLGPCRSSSTFLLLTHTNTRERKGFLPPGAFRHTHSPYNELFKHNGKKQDLIVYPVRRLSPAQLNFRVAFETRHD